ncbi:MAG: hypothetical protein OXB95_14535 [Rhodobacteraceae bacterium]|nr:hypothetical protein [Paracoccaceae bacterium]
MRQDRKGREPAHIHGPTANDIPGSEARTEDEVMRLARLLGQQIGRERFARPSLQ